jgi:benzylsuccinate CoA-transferase BbsF subunit
MTSKHQHDDPHFRERGTFLEVDHPKMGTETLYGIPWRLSETPGRIRRSGPMLGQDNDHVFRQLLGVCETDFDRLVQEKVIY